MAHVPTSLNQDFLNSFLAAPSLPFLFSTIVLTSDPYSTRDLLPHEKLTPQTPEDQLLILAHSDQLWDRLAISLWPHTPSALLAHLAHDPHPWVRQEIAWHPQTPEGDLQSLSQDPDPRTRVRVLLHPRWTSTEREALLLREPSTVIPSLKTVLNTARAVALMHARYPHTTATTLTWLFRWKSTTLRCALAYHPHCPIPILTQLAHSASLAIRLAVRQHPQTPLTLKTALLLRDGDQPAAHTQTWDPNAMLVPLYDADHQLIGQRVINNRYALDSLFPPLSTPFRSHR